MILLLKAIWSRLFFALEPTLEVLYKVWCFILNCLGLFWDTFGGAFIVSIFIVGGLFGVFGLTASLYVAENYAFEKPACYAQWKDTGYLVRWSLSGSCQISEDGKIWGNPEHFNVQLGSNWPTPTLHPVQRDGTVVRLPE